MYSAYQKFFLLLCGCLLTGLAYAKAGTVCQASDFSLKVVGGDGGAGSVEHVYALKNISWKTCFVHGYTAKTDVSGYIDGDWKKIANRKGKIDTAKVQSNRYTLHHNDSLYFTMQYAGPNGDINQLIRKVTLHFHGICGLFTIRDGAPVPAGYFSIYNGFDFGKLSRNKPNV